MGVSLIIQLDGSDYDAAPFIEAGIDVCSLLDLGCKRDEHVLSLQVRSLIVWIYAMRAKRK